MSGLSKDNETVVNNVKKPVKRRLKRLSDYQGDEALDIMGELLEPVSKIFMDKDISKTYKAANKNGENSMFTTASVILKSHKKEISEILLKIDDTPITGMNILKRIIGFLTDLGNEDEGNFFEYAEQEKTDSVSIGSATENTEDSAN